MAHGAAREGKWRGNWRMEWVASTLHTTSEHAVSSITTADAHTSAASIRLNWRPRRFKWRTCPFRRKTKSGFCACAITLQTQSTADKQKLGTMTDNLQCVHVFIHLHIAFQRQPLHRLKHLQYYAPYTADCRPTSTSHHSITICT